MSDLDSMRSLAAAARENAHAPYSGFKVGACLRTPDGSLFSGCNVENAAYPLGQCAEAGAIAALVAAGQTAIAEVVVVAEGAQLCTPCGGCRQRLVEFGTADTPVHVCSPTELRASFTLDELLPQAFDFEKPEA